MSSDEFRQIADGDRIQVEPGGPYMSLDIEVNCENSEPCSFSGFESQNSDAASALETPMDIQDHSGILRSDIRAKRRRRRAISECSNADESLDRKKSKGLPDNLTLRSAGENQIVVLYRQSDTSMGHVTLHPGVIGKCMVALKLPEGEIKDVRPNRRRNIIAVELNSDKKEIVDILMAITNIGKYPVKAYLPGPDSHIAYSGVIGPIGVDTNLDELLELQRRSPDLPPIVKMTRLSKFTNSVKETSLVVKVDFKEGPLPKKVFFNYISYAVREYNPPVIRCYRCQRIGHMAGGCNARERCLLCGGPHNRADCSFSLKCANCQGPHRASDRNCSYNRQALNTDKLVRSGVPYPEARRRASALYPVESYINSNVNNGCFSGHGAGVGNGELRVERVNVEVHKSQGSYFPSQFAPSEDIQVCPTPSPTPHKSNTDAVSSQQAQPNKKTQMSRSNVPSTYASHAAGLSSRDDGRRYQLRRARPVVSSSEGDVVVAEAVAACKEEISKSMNELCIKLGKFIKEAFSMQLHKKCKKECNLLLVSLARNHLGPQAGSALLSELDCSRNTPTPPNDNNGPIETLAQSDQHDLSDSGSDVPLEDSQIRNSQWDKIGNKHSYNLRTSQPDKYSTNTNTLHSNKKNDTKIPSGSCKPNHNFS